MNSDKKEVPTIVKIHFEKLHEKYNGFALVNGSTIAGTLRCEVGFNGYPTRKIAFDIEINIPDEYPNIPPTAKEIGGLVSKDFHKYEDNVLCLGTDLEINIKFNSNPTLLGFVESLVIPYLYSYSYWLSFGATPFGEQAHGDQGVLDNYCERFGIKSPIAMLKLFKFLVIKDFWFDLECPCGSNKELRKCHGEKVFEIKKYQSQHDFRNDFIKCLKSYCFMKKIDCDLMSRDEYNQYVRQLLKINKLKKSKTNTHTALRIY